MTESHDPIAATNQRQYRWPWVVLALFILGVGLAILWMSKEVQRARRIHDANTPASQPK